MKITGVQASPAYTALSSGSRINSAADDAAGLAIREKMNRQETGLSTGASNAQDGISLLNVADGALSGIQDSLQRIYELGVKASNGLYGDAEKQSIQKEIDGLKQSIQDTAKGTTFNTMKLLDGSMADIELATNPEGGGLKIQMANSTLESLGIADFDVTGDFNLDDIKKAMDMVSEARSRFGAQTNALEHTVNYNTYAAYNTAASESGLSDADYGEEILKKSREEVLEQYRIFGIKAQTEADAGILRLF